MNQLDVKSALDKLRSAQPDLMLEKNSRELAIAKTKIQEAIFWIEESLKIEGVFG